MDCNVGNFDFVFLDALALHTIIDHDVTERTRRRDAIGTGCQQLLRTLDVDVFAGGLFHPEASTASATAHALRAVLFGFEHLHAAERANDLARCNVDVVVTSEVTGVVVHDALFERCVAHVEVALFYELLEELAVVDDLVVATELRVLVSERVEAVRALGDDLLDAHAVERLDVLHCQKLEDVFVAGAASRVAGAVLGRAEDCVAHASTVHQLRQCLADLLVLVVERTSATNPVEVLGFERLVAGQHGD